MTSICAFKVRCCACVCVCVRVVYVKRSVGAWLAFPAFCASLTRPSRCVCGLEVTGGQTDSQLPVKLK